MRLIPQRPTKWLRNWAKRRTIINGDRTQLVQNRNGTWTHRYKKTIRGLK